MIRTIILILLASLLAQTCPAAGGTLTDKVLLDAFEKGRSLAAVEILSVRTENKFHYYKVKVLNLIVAGDLAPADIQHPVELFAGASYGEALKVGQQYALFIIKDAPRFFSWAHRDDVLALKAFDAEGIKRIEKQSSKVYSEAPICRFRNAKIGNAVNLRTIPQDIQNLCTRFKDEKEDRCELAKEIVKSDIGSHEDNTRKFSSDRTFLPLKIKLTRPQALQLLGKPTIKLGYTCRWFYGEEKDHSAGVLTIQFNGDGTVRTLIYETEPIKHWDEETN